MEGAVCSVQWFIRFQVPLGPDGPFPLIDETRR